MSSKIPRFLAGRLAALVLTLGAGGGAYLAADQAAIEQGLADQYVQAVAADTGTSQGVKVGMVLGHFYESSGRHIGTPYIDKLGKGSPTACIEYASTLSRVFGQCSQRYTELAIRADGHAADAATCRAAWPVILQTKENQ